ncbi:hypothetical protein BZL30_3942 [Mycobacterium kansasii]|uniref:Uncharacterized protein n=1 Tax=Mycobacterium kansasii TaxID=1768 RepID=A0A1V3XA76_MYCKA|nr:hypothetical protein BZL30_3942 [Mycobacterium kansasii]
MVARCARPTSCTATTAVPSWTRTPPPDRLLATVIGASQLTGRRPATPAQPMTTPAGPPPDEHHRDAHRQGNSRADVAAHRPTRQCEPEYHPDSNDPPNTELIEPGQCRPHRALRSRDAIAATRTPAATAPTNPMAMLRAR